jgi:hypothetical protein
MTRTMVTAFSAVNAVTLALGAVTAFCALTGALFGTGLARRKRLSWQVIEPPFHSATASGPPRRDTQLLVAFLNTGGSTISEKDFRAKTRVEFTEKRTRITAADYWLTDPSSVPRGKVDVDPRGTCLIETEAMNPGDLVVIWIEVAGYGRKRPDVDAWIEGGKFRELFDKAAPLPRFVGIALGGLAFAGLGYGAWEHSVWLMATAFVTVSVGIVMHAVARRNARLRRDRIVGETLTHSLWQRIATAIRSNGGSPG